MEKIVLLQMKNVEKRLEEKKIQLEISKKAIEHLATTGFDPIFGARPLKRLIQQEIVNLLANELIGGHIGAKSHIKIDVRQDKFIIETIKGI